MHTQTLAIRKKKMLRQQNQISGFPVGTAKTLALQKNTWACLNLIVSKMHLLHTEVQYFKTWIPECNIRHKFYAPMQHN